jgi:hypothetical protein
VQDPSLWPFVVLPAADDVMLPCTQVRYGLDQAPRRGAMDKNEPTVQSEGVSAGSIIADVYRGGYYVAKGLRVCVDTSEVAEVGVAREFPTCFLTRASAMAVWWQMGTTSPLSMWRLATR